MKVIAFAARPDEYRAFETFKEKFGITLELVGQNLSESNVDLAKGYDTVAVIGNCRVNRKVLEQLSSFGISFVASRSTGYDNIDLVAAKELGIGVSNAFYSPNSVGEFAVMCALNLLRRIPYSYKKSS